MRVASQQAAFGQPLDDLVVEGKSPNDGLARLSLQVKRSLIVSAAASNADFREVVLRAHETVRGVGLRERVDRVGLVTGTVADDAKRALETVCEWARDTAAPEAFAARFADGGPSGNRHRQVLGAIREILGGGSADPAAVDADVHRLLAHFVLLRFDLLHEGSTGEADAVARLRPHLAAEHADRADEVWRRLRLVAREAAGRAADYDRPTLLGRLLGAVRLAGAPSLRRNLERLAEEARLSLADIPNDIDGHLVARTGLVAQAEAGLLDRAFLQLAGLPGSGKSAVLRELAEARLRSGPALVLKADRLSGPNWASYARTIGLTATGLEALLAELAAVGSPVLFVDGIDRIAVEHRGVLLDLLRTILGSLALRAVWRTAATVRDNGLEPLRTWLPAELLGDGGVATVTVRPFDDDEARALAAARPALGPLLFGDERVREVARRPFFAAVLARSLPRPAGGDGGGATPRSETELVEAWWSGGGYRAAPPSVTRRQRTLVALARAGMAGAGRPIGTGLAGIDTDAVDELRRDGVLRDVRPGHSVRFAHDIFFEWAVLHLLIGREEAWLDEVRTAGEPPVLGRAVELLSQEAFSAGEGWAEQLGVIERSPLRPQWARAWLLGPLGAADFADRAAPFADVVFGDEARWFARLVVWFQAEKTRPNPLVLRGVAGKAGWSEREMAQAADALAVPSDYMTWTRCCAWIMDHAGRCPVATIPDVVSVFEVWQNALADIPNAVSGRVLALVQDWLEDIEDKRRPEEGFRLDRGRWGELEDGGIEELEGRLRSLLLRAARSAPERVGAYLARVRARRRLRGAAFEHILQFAPILSEAHAGALVELTASELFEELPADVAARPPEPGLFPRSFSYHDWDQLAISYKGHQFFPASPLREPFHSLLASSPADGLRLVRDLANHAIMAWRQLFDLDPERETTPVPLALDFPWGRQVFWGDGHVYQWFRGNWGPHPVEAGLMALERWAFAELERGRDADEVIREVVDGHDSVAVLGIAIALALTVRRASPATLPLAVDQRLWHWDLSRSVGDTTSPANTIGFTKPADRGHAEAVRDGNAREARRMEVRHLAQLFVLGADDALRDAARKAIQAFPRELPFDFEEEREAGTRVASLRRRAEIWAEFGRQENYVAIPAEDGKGYHVQLDNPRSADPDIVEGAERHATLVEHLTLLGWARDCFEQKSLSDKLDLAEALERARHLTNRDLFAGTPDDDPLDEKGSAVAGVAAAALRFAADLGQPDLAWAGDITLRAAEAPGKRGPLWSSRSKLPYHPGLWAAEGLAALARRGARTQEAGRALLRLAGHPHEQISAAAIGATLGCWDHDPGLAWTGLRLGLRLSVGERRGARISAFGYDHESHPERVARAVDEALRELDQTQAAPSASLPDLPEPWVFAPPSRRDHDPLFGPPDQPDPVWRDPDVFLRWDFLPKVLGQVAIGRVMDDPARRPAFLALCDRLVAWTIERLEPSWLGQSDRDRRDRRRADLYEWRSQLYAFLAQVVLHLEPEEVRRRFLEPAFALDDELAASLVRSFADRLVCTLMDAPSVDPRALALLEDCVSRVLRHEAWDEARRRAGELYGFDLPELVRTLFFVQVEHAGGAARFANGDWREVRQIFPVIDPLVRAVGDIPGVTLSYLTLCERAVDHYPAADFVAQVSAVLDKQPGIPAGWRGSTIPGRVAALVQAFAEKSQPLPLPLRRGMLLVLDRLVEMGDRRSAALQASEIFRNVALH